MLVGAGYCAWFSFTQLSLDQLFNNVDINLPALGASSVACAALEALHVGGGEFLVEDAIDQVQIVGAELLFQPSHQRLVVLRLTPLSFAIHC